MPARSKVLGNRTIGGKEALRVPGRLEALHTSLSLAGWLMGVLRTVVEGAVLAMFHPREDLPLGRAIALQFIRNDHAWYVLTALEELTEELLGRLLVPPSLHQDIEHLTVLIHRPPQIMPYLVNRDAHFIQVPRITWPGTPATEGMRIGLAKLAASLADGFVRYDHATDQQEFFPIAVAEREAEIQPDGMADDLPREAMMFIGIGWDWGRHGNSTEDDVWVRRVHASPEELRGWPEYAMSGCTCTGPWVSCQRH